MHFTNTRVAGARIIDLSPHHDERGRFMRAWCVREFEEQSGLPLPPILLRYLRILGLRPVQAAEKGLAACTFSQHTPAPRRGCK